MKNVQSKQNFEKGLIQKWLEDSVTKAFFGHIDNCTKEIVNDLMMSHKHSTIDEITIDFSRIKGYCEAIKDMLELRDRLIEEHAKGFFEI